MRIAGRLDAVPHALHFEDLLAAIRGAGGEYAFVVEEGEDVGYFSTAAYRYRLGVDTFGYPLLFIDSKTDGGHVEISGIDDALIAMPQTRIDWDPAGRTLCFDRRVYSRTEAITLVDSVHDVLSELSSRYPPELFVFPMQS